MKKLQKIAFENPEHFDFPNKMEEKYGNFFPQQRLEKFINEGKEIPKDIKFFRGHLSAKDILKNAYPHKISEDSRYLGIQLRIDDMDLVGGESCEIYSECGS